MLRMSGSTTGTPTSSPAVETRESASRLPLTQAVSPDQCASLRVVIVSRATAPSRLIPSRSPLSGPPPGGASTVLLTTPIGTPTTLAPRLDERERLRGVSWEPLSEDETASRAPARSSATAERETSATSPPAVARHGLVGGAATAVPLAVATKPATRNRDTKKERMRLTRGSTQLARWCPRTPLTIPAGRYRALRDNFKRRPGSGAGVDSERPARCRSDSRASPAARFLSCLASRR